MDSSIAFTIFGFGIRWYSLVYSIGSLIAYFYFIKYFKHKTLSEDDKDKIFFTTLFVSLICARLTYCFAYFPQHYFFNLIDVIKIWDGGMSINGGFLGFFLSFYYFSKGYHISIYKFTDFFMLPGLLALSFGRLGNFFNQEVYGIPTSSNLGIVFPAVDELSRYPYQLFAGLKNLIAFEIMLYLQLFKKLKTGAITLISGMLYTFGRFFLDFMREPTTLYFGFPLGQWFSLIIFFVCSFLLWKLYRKIENS